MTSLSDPRSQTSHGSAARSIHLARPSSSRPPSPVLRLEPKLLIVDDNPRIHEDFHKVLGRPHDTAALDAAEEALFGSRRPSRRADRTFEIEDAQQGAEALQLAQQAAARGVCYAAAFIDIRMPPGWDGLRTARELWAIDPGLQVVFCTAFSDYTWQDMLEHLGPSQDFLILRKPFDALEVRQLALALTEKRRLLLKNQAHLSELEEKVSQRTAQLERAKSQLQQEMTERLVLERGLRQAQKLEALGRLVAGIGHEINNPLAYVASNLEYAIAEIHEASNTHRDERLESLRAVLADAAQGAERIKRIIHGVRLYSRPWEAAPTAVDLYETLRTAQVIVANELRHRASVTEHFVDVPLVVGDPNRLEQVFVNLLLNASQALPEDSRGKGEIHLRTEMLDPNDVAIHISDNGQGIPEDQLERVFEPFHSTRPIGRGTGLGLWVCKCILDSLGGRIELASQEGRGTTATVILKAATVASETPATATLRLVTDRPVPCKVRLLIVDDEVPLLRALQRSLRQHQTTICRDGQDALTLYEQNTFDLVLCDMMMPRLGGMDFYYSLARKGSEHTQRIVFMTGGVLTDPIREFLASVKNPWLGKPFSTNELLQTIQRQWALVGAAQES